LAKFEGIAHSLSSRIEDGKAPSIFLDYIKVEGPFPSENSASQADEPVTFLKRFEAEKREDLGIRMEEKMVKHRFNSELKMENGPFKHWPHKDGILMRQGGPVYERGATYGRLCRLEASKRIPEDGYYKIRFKGGADSGYRDEPINVRIRYGGKLPIEVNTETPVKGTLEDPLVHEVILDLRNGGKDITKRNFEFFWNDERKYIITADESNKFFKDIIGTAGKIQKGKAAGTLSAEEEQELRDFLADAKERTNQWKGPGVVINPKLKDKEPPKFYLDWIELEGPIRQEWPPPSHKEVLFAGNSRSDAQYLLEIFQKFLPRAYRRPVEKEEVDSAVSVSAAHLKKGGSFTEAVRIGLQRVLTSPGFLFIQEPAAKTRPLNQYELASRLSYFLWSTMPDEQLFTLAEKGQLHQSGVLKSEIQRMLAAPKAREFVENFTGQWLSAREFGSVMPAESYKEYDKSLEEASKEEAFAFFQEILSKDLPITNFLNSDFLVINERLARHYEIEGVEGKEFRRVALKPEDNRGGIFGMVGLMTLLADGTRTLPVRRAAWIRENLFNDPPPPPPPNAGEVQPNTSGNKLTVRERLDRHRDEPTCASCHATLDPFGLALENYDAIGKWRTRQNGENFRGKNEPLLDVSGELPGDHKFTNLNEYKSALLDQKDAFAKAFSERMLTYALCRPVGFVDNKEVSELVSTLQKNEYRIQPLIEAIVMSKAFQTK